MTLFSRGYNPDAVIAALAQPTIEGLQRAFNSLSIGARRLVDPRASLGPARVQLQPMPAIDSPITAAETLEVGLMAALRDQPLADLAPDPAHAAILNAIAPTVFPRDPAGLFRLSPADRSARVGRLLTRPIPTGWSTIGFTPRLRAGSYGATESAWQSWQGGYIPAPQQFDPNAPLAVTGRWLASLVHQDAPYLIPLMVSQQLLAAKAPLSNRFPVQVTETPFVAGGGAVALQCGIAASCQAAMRDAWRYKWTLNRPRPDQLWRLGIEGRLHPDFLAKGQPIIDLVGPFLSSCYAEGAPIHSDYPAGHAVIAGAGFTILKAWFTNGPVQALEIYDLHHELNLMAWHMAVGRSWAGIHTRSSLLAGLALGEVHAVAHLNALRLAEHPAQMVRESRIFGFQGQELRV